MQKTLLTFLLSLLLQIGFAQNLSLFTEQLPEQQTAAKMTEDENGNIYMLGRYYTSISFGSLSVSASGLFYTDVYLVKFDRYFNPIWLKSFGSSKEDGIGGICYYNGSVYFSGYYGDTMTVGAFSLPFSQGTNVNPGFIIQVDTAGIVQHATEISSANCVNGTVTSIAVRNNTIAIGGVFKGTIVLGGFQVASTLAGSETDAYVAAFDINYTPKWIVQGTSVRGSDRGVDGTTSVDIDALENVYAGGYFGSIPTLGNATFYLGSQSTTAVGGFGFTNFYFAKINSSSGNVAWLQSSGGGLPSAINNICLYNDTLLALAGRYSDFASVGGIALPASPSAYSKFLAVVDTSGMGRSAIRTGTNENFLSLKKSGDYLYAVDYTAGTSDYVFGIFKYHPDSGLLYLDTINLNTYSLSMDIIPPSQSCGQIKVCGSFSQYVKYHGNDVLNLPLAQQTGDYFYGYYDADGQLLNPPVLSAGSTTLCSGYEALITTPTNTNVTQYNWEVDPPGSASLLASNNELRITPNPSFTGTLYVTCYLTNFCSRSELSDTLRLTVNASPVINEITSVGSAVNTVVTNAADFRWLYNGTPIVFDNQNFIPCLGPGNYTVIALSASGCTDTLTEFITCTSGTDNPLNYSKLVLSPQPSDAGFRISGLFENALFTMTDLTGAVVYSSVISNGDLIKTSTLANGSYSYSLQDKGNLFRGKILVFH